MIKRVDKDVVKYILKQKWGKDEPIVHQAHHSSRLDVHVTYTVNTQQYRLQIEKEEYEDGMKKYTRIRNLNDLLDDKN